VSRAWVAAKVADRKLCYNHLVIENTYVSSARPSGCGFRLDSAPGLPSPWSRWSYLPQRPILHLRGDASGAWLRSSREVIRSWADPLAALAWMERTAKEPPTSGPPFKGGWIGYLSYDLGRLFEPIRPLAAADTGFPLFEFTYHPGVIACGPEALSVRSTHPFDPTPLEFPAVYRLTSRQAVSNFSRAGYQATVARAIDYIAAGDIFQVNLAQRFTVGLPQKPGDIYHSLLRRWPAWFGAYLDYGDHAILSNSPELFFRVTPDPATRKRTIVTRPIKGTRPCGQGMENKLRDSIKDQAELNMIIDLERNDLGRICALGSVRVTQPRIIEQHPTVCHGAATVEGELSQGVGLVELFRCVFPGGSITGAPKIRAMQIIEELEPCRRGPYCGAIGYLSVDGHMAFNVAIRTMMIEVDHLHIAVGGGIVADSLPADEYEETLVKARALFDALGCQERSGMFIMPP